MTTLMKVHPHEWPPYESAPSWMTTLMNDHPHESAPSWMTTLWKRTLFKWPLFIEDQHSLMTTLIKKEKFLNPHQWPPLLKKALMNDHPYWEWALMNDHTDERACSFSTQTHTSYNQQCNIFQQQLEHIFRCLTARFTVHCKDKTFWTHQLILLLCMVIFIKKKHGGWKSIQQWSIHRMEEWLLIINSQNDITWIQHCPLNSTLKNSQWCNPY